ncbi:MAG TPA: POTRA domain-containing protein [Flavobacterium sp.]|nr:POTRA domain-containing protein [Flavobacterium sp.]
MLHKILKLVLTLFLIGNISQIKAQDRVPFGQGKKYILADVDVIGKITYNPQTIVIFSGLQKGQDVIIPGDEISNSIKKLGKLGLFSDIDFYVNKVEGDSIYLQLEITELPKLSEVKIVGVKTAKSEEFIKDLGLVKGKVVNENLLTETSNYIERKYKKDGYFNTKVVINNIPDTLAGNEVKMLVNVDKGEKLKINDIVFSGNKFFNDDQLRSIMKNTKHQSITHVLKSSKYVEDKFQEDLESIVSKYKEKGYRDARIVSDSVAYNPTINKLSIYVGIQEGNKYYFGDIKFIGNSVYTDYQLMAKLGINKGDVYNGVQLEKRIADKNPDADDITNLYQNNGYLFSNVNAVEVGTANDSINFEIRVVEGPLAYFNKITVVGNDKTYDRVIYRELRTRPGQKYNKEELVRTIREIGQLGFFDPEAIEPRFKNVDAAAGTVDIEYHVVEKGSSQIELQGGYGGGGFVGTLGLSFNNFSMRNLFNPEAYKPLPMGDGQKIALRLQASTYFRTYSFSFSEPWFGGKKPIGFSTSFAYSQQFQIARTGGGVDRDRYFNILSVSTGLSKRLKWPDDFFGLSQSLSFQYYDLHNYNTGLFRSFSNGTSRNLAYTVSLSRNSRGSNPIFPTYGSDFTLTGRFTLPYSSFNNINYANLQYEEEYKLRNNTNQEIVGKDGEIIMPGDYITKDGNRADYWPLAAADQGKVDQEKYYWLEFYKIKFRADWYTTIYGKLVMRTLAEFGFLGAYNQSRGVVPFERFYLGGDGLANNAQDGREVIQLRGYPNYSLSGQVGSSMFNKFSLELRYPITMKQAASIYVLSFLEAGNAYNDYQVYNPFGLYRSAGAGLRVFMPAFGLLGIDFGYGFDALPGQPEPNGFETHFIIGQQF